MGYLGYYHPVDAASVHPSGRFRLRTGGQRCDTAHGYPNVNVCAQTWIKYTHILIVRKTCCGCLVWPLKITVVTTAVVLPGKCSVSLS